MERGEMESREAIVTQTYRVDPTSKLCFPRFLLFLIDVDAISLTTASIDKSILLVLIVAQYESDDDFDGLFDVFVCCIMDRRIATLVIDAGDFNLVSRGSQQVVQLLELLSLDVLVDELFHILLLFG